MMSEQNERVAPKIEPREGAIYFVVNDAGEPVSDPCHSLYAARGERDFVDDPPAKDHRGSERRRYRIVRVPWRADPGKATVVDDPRTGVGYGPA